MSWSTGIYFNIAICFGIAFFISLLRIKWIRILSYLASPTFSAWVLYWLLAYIESGGSPSSEYSSWVGAFVVPWALSGYLGLGVAILISKQRRSKNGS